MVEKELMDIIQIFSWVTTATGVCFAAYYYITTLRNNQRALRINMTNNLLQQFSSEEGQRRWIELMNWKWSSYDEFERKYGSDNNPDAYAKRQSIIYNFDTLGHLLREGLVDRETVYNVISTTSSWLYLKYRAFLDEHMRRYRGSDAYAGFEYLASEMIRMRRERDPNYRIPELFTEYVPNK